MKEEGGYGEVGGGVVMKRRGVKVLRR